MGRRGSLLTQAIHNRPRVATTAGRGAPAVSSTDLRLVPRTWAAAVLGGYLRSWIPLEGDKNASNVVFTFPPGVSAAIDVGDVPVVGPVFWRRTVLHYTTAETPAEGSFTMRSDPTGLWTQFILGEAPQASDALVVQYVVLPF